MNLKDLRDGFRNQADDAVSPFLWEDPEVNQFFNEAENEACQRALLLEDSDSPRICRISLTAGKASYTLSPLVIEVRRARVASERHTLEFRNEEWLDQNYCFGWETRTGVPKYAILSKTKFRPVPIPEASDTVLMTVFRLPEEPMVDNEDEPEIQEVYHYRLIDWALRCAYLKQDADTYDPVKAAAAEARFTASFGERPDANVLRKQARRKPTIVRSVF